LGRGCMFCVQGFVRVGEWWKMVGERGCWGQAEWRWNLLSPLRWRAPCALRGGWMSPWSFVEQEGWRGALRRKGEMQCGVCKIGDADGWCERPVCCVEGGGAVGCRLVEQEGWRGALRRKGASERCSVESARLVMQAAGV
jgi:hypothetical protein